MILEKFLFRLRGSGRQTLLPFQAAAARSRILPRGCIGRPAIPLSQKLVSLAALREPHGSSSSDAGLYSSPRHENLRPGAPRLSSARAVTTPAVRESSRATGLPDARLAQLAKVPTADEVPSRGDPASCKVACHEGSLHQDVRPGAGRGDEETRGYG